MCTLGECYVCKRPAPVRHSFYDQLCPDCGEFNWRKRQCTADLSGYNALVTGGRTKVGFETALKLLRCGARVIVTTRFVSNAGMRFYQQPDANVWDGRLSILAADFRVPALVEELIRHIRNEEKRLDILINNAAQTVRRPPVFYRHLIPSSSQPLRLAHPDELLAASSCLGVGEVVVTNGADVALLSQVELHPDDSHCDPNMFPHGCFDKDGQQEDRRSFNSWMMKLPDVHLIELLEVLYINVVAPFLLCQGLKTLMRKDPRERPSFIVNVTAMEGNFYDPRKDCRHPHTNMAKAALNMMTRTAASEFQEDGIFMSSVDPGWITNERPFPLDEVPSTRRWKMAIDEVDGAARVCDPIFRALNDGDYSFGVLFKNYRAYPW